MTETVIIDDSNRWTSQDGEVFTTTNDNGDTIRALRSDFASDDEAAEG